VCDLQSVELLLHKVLTVHWLVMCGHV